MLPLGRGALKVLAGACGSVLVILAAGLGVFTRAYDRTVPIIDAAGQLAAVAEQPLPLDSLDFLTILIVGLDSVYHTNPGIRGGASFSEIPLDKVRGRSDTIIVLGLDRRTRSVRMLHIPRDTIVPVPGRDIEKIGHYITYHSFFHLKAAVEDLLQVPIHRYVVVDFEGFKTLVDAIGGVTVTVDHDLLYPGGVWLPKGTHRLDGAMSLRLVRHRYGERRADIDRIQLQRTFLVALGRELAAGGFRKALAAYLRSPDTVKTNITAGETLRLFREWRDYDPDSLEHLWLPGRPELHYWRVDPVGVRETVERFWPHDPAPEPAPPRDPGDARPSRPSRPEDPPLATGPGSRPGSSAPGIAAWGTPGTAIRLNVAGLVGVEVARLWDVAYRPYLRAHSGVRAPVAVVYHTHASESFLPELYPDPEARAGLDPDLRAYTQDPELSVARVGRELARALGELGLDCRHLPDVHDAGAPEGRIGAYERSRATLTAALSSATGPVLVLDIHRDAVTGRAALGDRTAASILLVVARQNPWWQWNYTFARGLAERLEAAAPGLCRGVRILDGTYNLDVSPLALVVEIGGAESTLDECLLSAHVLAGVIADYFQGP
ncbi:MAG: stage II sporulation protein P [Bacillota bacterium]